MDEAKHEGKRNFNKKKWRETQYSHKERGMSTKYNILCVCFEEEVIDVVLLPNLQSIVIVLVSEWDSKRKLAVKRKYHKMLQKGDSSQSYQAISNMYKEEEEGGRSDGPPLMPEKKYIANHLLTVSLAF